MPRKANVTRGTTPEAKRYWSDQERMHDTAHVTIMWRGGKVAFSFVADSWSKVQKEAAVTIGGIFHPIPGTIPGTCQGAASPLRSCGPGDSMTRIKRVVDARRNQGRLLYHLQCGHTAQTTEPLTVDGRELGVGDEVDCNIDNCSTANINQPPPNPRFAQAWVDIFVASMRLEYPLNPAERASFADECMAEYRKRFP
jgi:hypothetical protein